MLRRNPSLPGDTDTGMIGVRSSADRDDAAVPGVAGHAGAGGGGSGRRRYFADDVTPAPLDSPVRRRGARGRGARGTGQLGQLSIAAILVSVLGTAFLWAAAQRRAAETAPQHLRPPPSGTSPPHPSLQYDAAGMAVPPSWALDLVSDDRPVRAVLKFLSSDLFQGRATGSDGERFTVEYLVSQMESYGLEPAAGTSYEQRVLLRTVRILSSSKMRVWARDGSGEDDALQLSPEDDFVTLTDADDVQSLFRGEELVFCGYGIRAEPYAWDDYDGAEDLVRGRVLVVLVNEPAATAEEPDLFAADYLTYFGRWTYKLEQAARMGARGVLMIHTDDSAGYPFSVPLVSYVSTKFSLPCKGDGCSKRVLKLHGWLTELAADRLARKAGSSLAEWQSLASQRAFKPFLLPVVFDLEQSYQLGQAFGVNVAGRLPGQARRQERILFSAHHDHLGINEALQAQTVTNTMSHVKGKDGIYNGAIDNASGVAAVLSIMRAFAELHARGERIDRTIEFVFFTAEEQQLLGAAAYVQAQRRDQLRNIVLNLNYDVLNVWGPTRDLVVLGAETSTSLLHWSKTIGTHEGLRIVDDDEPGLGHFFRGDQFMCYLSGVPAINPVHGKDFVDRDLEYAEKVSLHWRTQVYHRPLDEYDPDWDLGGLQQEVRFGFRFGYALAVSSHRFAFNEDMSPDSFSGASERGAIPPV